MTSRYPHWLIITRAGAGGSSDVDGIYTPAAPEPVYDGPADVQDSGGVMSRDRGGVPVEVSDAKAYLAVPEAISTVHENDRVEIYWQDKLATTSDAVVAQVRREDCVLFLRRL